MRIIPKLSELKWLPEAEQAYWRGWIDAMNMKTNETEITGDPSRPGLEILSGLRKQNPDMSLAEIMQVWKGLQPRYRTKIGLYGFTKMYEHLPRSEVFTKWQAYLKSCPYY